MTATVERAQQDASEQRAAALALLPMQAAGPTQGFLRGTAESVRSIWAYRELLYLLFRRELKTRYKDSVLGFVWSLVRPIAQMLVYAIAIGIFLGASKSIKDYPIYVFSGLTIWQLFAEIVGIGTGAILANGGLVKKIYLPREVFPLSVVGSALFNFMMQMVVLVAGTFAFGAPPSGRVLLYAPLAVVLIVVWATAFAFVLGAVNVYLRDMAYLVEIALMWGMWTAPIVYAWSRVEKSRIGVHEWSRDLYLANPITEAALAFQRAFWVRGADQPVPDGLARDMVVGIAVGLVVLWMCQRVFARLQANFAQEL